MQPPVKVAFLIDQLVNDSSGTEKQLLETIRRLDKNRFLPYLLCLSPTEFIQNNPLPVEPTVLDYKGLLKRNVLTVAHNLRRFAEQNEIDLIHAFFEDSIFVSALAFRGQKNRPALVSSRRDIGMGNGVPWYHGLFNLARPYALKSFDGVFTNARAVQNHSIQRDKVPEEKTHVIYNGLDLAAQTLPQPAVFNEKNVDFWILLLANFNQVKRHDVFMEALRLLRKEKPDLRFRAVLMGQGPMLEAMKNLAQEYGLEDNVRFEGPVKNVEAYLPHGDVGVLCSDKEGLSNAILEYMKYALPIVATRTGGNPELVDDANGALVPTGDAPALKEALKTLSGNADLRKEMGLASRAKAIRLFSWEKTIHELEIAYLNLVRERKLSQSNSG